MTKFSRDFTVKSNARRDARKAGLDPSTVQPFVKAGKTLYRFPLPAEAPKAAAKPAKAKAAKAKAAKAKSSKAPQAANQNKGLAAIGNKKPRKASVSSGSKFEQVAAMLRKDGGASMPSITEATGWKPHTARARISVDVSKLLNKGEEITRRRDAGVSHYSIVKSKQMDLPIADVA